MDEITHIPEDIRSLIVSSNPKHDSLTVHAAEFAKTHLEVANVSSRHINLDKVQFNLVFSSEDLLRRASFDTQVVAFQKILSKIDCLCLFFPDWWGFPPALLLAWLQKVFAPGYAFAFVGDDYMPKEIQPLLKSLKIFLAITTDEKLSQALNFTISVLRDKLFHYSGVTQIEHSILTNTRERKVHEIHNWIEHNAERILGLINS